MVSALLTTFLHRWTWVSLFFSAWVVGASKIISMATDVYAQRAADVKEATAQPTEWKVSLAMPVLSVRMALWCFPQLSSPAAHGLLLRTKWEYTPALGSPCCLWGESLNPAHCLPGQSELMRKNSTEYRQRLSGQDPLTPCNPPYLYSKDHMELFREEKGKQLWRKKKKIIKAFFRENISFQKQ